MSSKWSKLTGKLIIKYERQVTMTLPDLSDLKKVDRVLFCEQKRMTVSFMHCPLCNVFPCKQLPADEVRELHLSPLMERRVVKFIPRRVKLYIIKYLDGTLKEAPNLDPNHPEWELMQNVEIVYQVGKELVPVIILRPKPQAEREKVNKAAKKKLL